LLFVIADVAYSQHGFRFAMARGRNARCSGDSPSSLNPQSYKVSLSSLLNRALASPTDSSIVNVLAILAIEAVLSWEALPLFLDRALFPTGLPG
jgi:hypothetical protein